MKGSPPSAGVAVFGILSLSLLVIGSALAIGTVHVPVLLILGCVTVLVCSTLLYIERSAIRRLPAPAWVLIGLAVWSALQAIPLPISLLSIFAPRNADVWARALRPLGEAPLSKGSISLDPGASCVEALKFFVYAMVFTMAHRFGRLAAGKSGLAIAFVSAVVVSLVTLIHGLTGSTSLYGLYTPELVTPRWGLSPILNPNNLSGYLNLGAFSGLGLLLAKRSGDEPSYAATRVVIASGIAIVVAVSMLGASRGGALGLAVGILLLGALLLIFANKTRGAARSSSRSRARSMLPALTAVGGGVLLAVVGASHATWAELHETSTEKIRLWEWSVPLIRDFPWFGVGRGAFETIFPAYRGVAAHIVFTHAENFILQWMSEWGIPIAVAALVALVWMICPRTTDFARDRAKLAAFVGVVVLLFQNLVDLALEIPSIAVLFSLVLGSLWEPSERAEIGLEGATSAWGRRFRSLRRWIFGRGSRRMVSYGVFAGGALALELAFAFGKHPVDEERLEIHRAYEKAAFGPSQVFDSFLIRLRDAILRHPAEPYFPLLGALAADRTQGGKVLPWVVAALERDVVNARAHLVLAGVLMRKHALDQGLMELRFAVQYDPGLAGVAGQLAGRSTHDIERLDRAAPSGGPGSGMLLTAATTIPSDAEPELRSKLLDLAVDRDPKFIVARVTRARELLAAISRKSLPCALESRSECIQRVRIDADAIRRLDPTSCDPISLKAQLLGIEGEWGKGEALLAGECASCSDQVRCTQERVSMASQLTAAEPFVVAARAYLGAACGEEDRCLGAHMLVGELYARRGLWTIAAEHYQEAASKGRNAEWWLRTADASLKAGQTARASLALVRARRDGAGNTALELRIEAIQAQLAEREGGSPGLN